jgi:hypothetical protein
MILAVLSHFALWLAHAVKSANIGFLSKRRNSVLFNHMQLRDCQSVSTWQTVRKVRHCYSFFLWSWHDWNAERGMFFIVIPLRLRPDVGPLNVLILAVLILWVWKIHSLVINTIAWVLEADFLKLNDNSVGEACYKAPVALCLLLLEVPWRSLVQKQV